MEERSWIEGFVKIDNNFTQVLLSFRIFIISRSPTDR